MDDRLFGLALLVAVSLLTTAHADNHGGGGATGDELPAGCNATEVMQCLSPFTGSGVLAPFVSGNASSSMEALTAAIANTTHLRHVCQVWEQVNGCLEPQEAVCLDQSSANNFTDLLHLDLRVPRVDQQGGDYQRLCSAWTFCLSKLGHCTAQFPELMADDVTAEDQETCRSMEKLADCVKQEVVPDGCQVLPPVTKAMKGLERGRNYCEQLRCSELNVCKNQFYSGGPSTEGLDDKTCFLYSTFVKCAHKAVTSSCSDVTLPRQLQSLDRVGGIVQEACTAMGKDEVKAIYSCSSFSNCLSPVMADDSFFLSNVCPIVQGVLMCAAKAVTICTGVDSAKVAEFKSQAVALAFKAQTFGCGYARVFTDDCSGLAACENALESGDDSTFSAMCTKVKDFENCTGSALDNCGLTGPDKLPSGADQGPHMSRLYPITERLCTALQGQSILSCWEFVTCVDALSIPDHQDGERFSAPFWCNYHLGGLECALSMSRTCSVPRPLMDKLKQIRDDLHKEGCHSMFDVFDVPSDDDNDGTGGTQSLAGPSLMAILMLPLLNLL